MATGEAYLLAFTLDIRMGGGLAAPDWADGPDGITAEVAGTGTTNTISIKSNDIHCAHLAAETLRRAITDCFFKKNHNTCGNPLETLWRSECGLGRLIRTKNL